MCKTHSPSFDGIAGVSTSGTPACCAVIADARNVRSINPAGHDVVLFNDELFSQLRSVAGVPADFVNDGWSFDSLESGGAKGGCLMAFVGSEYVVKELSMDDHESLLEVSRSYFEHVRDGKTLLGLVFLHFEDIASSRKFMVMRNVTGGGQFLALYDLKGCNDDKTIELFGEKVLTGDDLFSTAGRLCGCFMPKQWRKDAADSSASKIAATRVEFLVSQNQRMDVLDRIHRDSAWLSSHQLMDYSLLVGVKSGPKGFAPETVFGQSPLVRSCDDGSEVALCIGIIDFLQKWNFKKIVARSIKCLELNKATVPPAQYAERFNDYFEGRFVCPKVRSLPNLLESTPKAGEKGSPYWKSLDLPQRRQTEISPLKQRPMPTVIGN